jgi:SAM-dependent methyltransferase
LRWFFHHLYHSLAWTYDFVASSVSLGRWFLWIDSVIPFLQGARILELGHGTGHLQHRFADMPGLTPFGLDESRQMAALTKRRARAAGHAAPNGRAWPRLPFQQKHTVVATFPTEFIFQLVPLARFIGAEVNGRLVVLPVAWIVGRTSSKGGCRLFAFTRGALPRRMGSGKTDAAAPGRGLRG